MDEKIIIPIVMFLLAGWSFYRAQRSSKSGTTRQLPSGEYVHVPGNIPWYKTFAGIVAIILVFINIFIIWGMVAEK